MTNPPTTQEIRLYIDGEVTPKESARLESLIENDEALRQHVQFERKLKGHISHVITRQAGVAPEDLASQIHAKLDQADRTVVGSISPQPRSGWLDGPKRANIFAVAATLLIVVGAVLFGIFGRSIDDIRPGPGTDVISDSAQFVAGEHNRCVNSEASRNRKISITDPTTAYQFIAKHLGITSVPVIDLSNLGYEFMGAGRCGVPFAERSAHVMYRKKQSVNDRSPMVSLFIAPDSGLLGYNGPCGVLSEAWTECVGGQSSDRRVLISINGRIAYFLCSSNNEDLERIAEAITFQIQSP